ncbi:antimicrobial peptide ABC transporter permease [Lactobacillus selangorensis]|uniref:Antimicrobial peptide ABC transporter permease n=1 Tax=Lactobacillus selangorensis TaxID=81857 RepID=A0A0R2FY35_9LACO|nr:FtsX-like permease family protein [Lactobacillus selangorensis]KRN28744.1 antimicrobial peptide ABC transporter permease [Lactobacillus selangorensis]KRN32846.1 antimicrobial peptide ABC transporter permease [Lactobacillus selangorensis]
MKPITKNMWRDIRANKGRFIAIVMIIFLGCLIFVGIRTTGPGLNDSLDKTVTDAHLSDIQLFSSTGFNQTDVKTAEKVKGAHAQAVKFKYVVGGKDELTVALYGYTNNKGQNRLSLESGHFPTKKNEIVLDQRAKDNFGYRLGQTFTFAKNAGLKQRTYKVVGFADSPAYIDNTSRGSANVGDGTVRFFAYIPQQQMNLSAATMLLIRFPKLQTENTYSKAYKHDVAQKKAALKAVFKKRGTTRSQQLLAAAMKPIKAQQARLTAAKQMAGGTMTAEMSAAQAKLTAAAKQAQAATKTTYTWQTRTDLPSFSAFQDTSDRIAAIANVFPVFFFLIAALITFTTITRMVEEARGQIGTLKALGYSKHAIARNYLMYALTAGLLGAVLGSIFGNLTLPRFILSMYRTNIPMTPDVPFIWSDFGLALLFSLLATVGAAFYVTRRELKEKPSELMRPRAPKSAKRILMERIKPLWRRLSFNQKVSYRNLFRYKSRMIMTIIGIAGGTALLITGFGLRDSILNTSTQQFGHIFHYQATVRLKEPSKVAQTDAVLKTSPIYQSAAGVNAFSGKTKAHGQQVNDVNFFVPADQRTFKKYIQLTNGKQNLSLPKRGVIISTKIAQTLGIGTGDTLTITPTNGQAHQVKVAGVTKNYMGVFAYMSKSAYRAAFNQAGTVNTLLVRLKKPTAKQRNKLAKQLLNDGNALGTSYTADQAQTITTMSGTLTPVVGIFILLSGVLSFVVLYNLTNINVSERMRELSTLKVLGFYDNEVTLYVVRENIILTLVGIIVGFGVGWGLLAYILQQATTLSVIFPIVIHWEGYVASTILMVLFTAIVMAITYQRLKRVDMLAALNSNE